MREQTLKKVDMEFLNTQLQKNKSEVNSQIEMAINDTAFQKRTQDLEKCEEKVSKADLNAERALDEVFFFKEQMKSL